MADHRHDWAVYPLHMVCVTCGARRGLSEQSVKDFVKGKA